jgi:cytochrome c oxidase subunit 2
VRYSGKDNTLGKFDYKLTSELNPLAIMTSASIEISLLEMQFGEDGTIALTNKLQESPEQLSSKGIEEIKDEIGKKEKFIRLLSQMRSKHDTVIDIAAMDDIILTDTLVLCVNEAYEFRFRSKDVIHSAYFPEFRAQMNTVPGMTTRFKFTPTITTKEIRLKRKDTKFEYTLMCNKNCGVGHNTMKMVVRVLEKEEFDRWMKSNDSKTFETTNNAMKLKKKTYQMGEH